MKTRLAVLVLAAVAGSSHAQPRGAVLAVDSIEAVVTVTNVDQAARTVTMRGPRGNLVVLQVPADAQNLGQVTPGARIRVRYSEAVALTISKGGKPSAGAAESVILSPKGGTPGGVAVRTLQASGVVDAIDYDSRYITMRGPKGGLPQSFRVPEEVKNLEQINGGDRITVSYVQAFALRMLPLERK